MGGIMANGGPSPATPGVTVDEGSITNDGFWPDIHLADLRAATRVTGNITTDRLKASTIEAMLFVNGKLASFRAQQIAGGWDSAADIGETIAGSKAIVLRYQRAVQSSVAADVAEKYRDWDNTRAGDYRADFESLAADDHRRNAQWAIADILGRPRNVTELL